MAHTISRTEQLNPRTLLVDVNVTVPVIVVEPDSTDPDSDAAEIDRLVTQHVENTHRAGLTTSEEIGVAGQLAAFGLSVHQIARRTRTKKAQVEKAVAAAASELAAKAGDLG
jgi:ParB family transcriptional regulator, chromosome partitioning protein